MYSPAFYREFPSIQFNPLTLATLHVHAREFMLYFLTGRWITEMMGSHS